MKVVILAGGLGTRISEETETRPKPMIEVGGRPILWHIMKIYTAHGLTEFVVCLGYKGYIIKEFFSNYALHCSDVTFDMRTRTMEAHKARAESWRVTLVDTGAETMTGGRVKRVREYLGDEDFCLTYGDGVGNVDIAKLLAFHKGHGKLATMTVVQPPGRFGSVELEQGRVSRFVEKPQGDGGWINGGFFVLSPKALDFIDGDATLWEREPMERLAAQGQLMAYQHEGFWQPLDTLRDKRHLEDLWVSGQAPWKTWED